MKKLLMPVMLAMTLMLGACGSQKVSESGSSPSPSSAPVATASAAATVVYQSETGPVNVPAHPERVVAMNASTTGHILALGVNVVGVDVWSKNNPRFAPLIKNAAEVSEENVEQIMNLKPDLIIAASTTKNLDKLAKIAPVVTYTYNKVDYLQQYIEVGKALNQEAKATAWVKDFKARAGKAGDEIRAKIGETATISVVESWDKQLSVFGDSWGRGTEILYKEMKLKMPEKVKAMVQKDGYYAISPEVLPEYAGDYVIFSKSAEADNSFQNSSVYKSIPAVKNQHVFEANAKEFYFNDPLTLDFQLDFFTKSLLGK